MYDPHHSHFYCIRRVLIKCLLIFVGSTTLVTNASEIETKSNTKIEVNQIKNTKQNVDAQEQADLLKKKDLIVSKQYMAFAKAIDNFLSGKNSDQDVNQSYLKVITSLSWLKSREFKSDQSVKLKLDLPNTEKRFKLVFNSDADEKRSLSERTTDAASDRRFSKDKSLASLEYSDTAEINEWQNSTNLGIETSGNIDTFVRYRLKKLTPISKISQHYFRQDVWYFHDKGWGYTTRSDTESELSDSLSFRWLLEFEYLNETNEVKSLNAAIFSEKLSDISSFDFRLGAIGTNQPNAHVEQYIFNVHYRRRIYSDWLFMSVGPELRIHKNEGWTSEPSLTIRLESFFSD